MRPLDVVEQARALSARDRVPRAEIEAVQQQRLDASSRTLASALRITEHGFPRQTAVSSFARCRRSTRRR
jgi:hypothetical protein